MEPTSLPQFVRVILERVAKENGFQNPRFEVKGGSEQGGNFLGQIVRLTISEGDNSKAALNLIIKHAPQSDRRRELYRTKQYFKREAYVYDVVFPTLTRLLKTKGAVSQNQVAFPSTARVYATHLSDDGAEDIIIMEDMNARGFVMGDRFLGVDAEHCRIVIRQLARLHAASLVLKEENPEEHSQLADSLEEIACISEFKDLFSTFANDVLPMISARFPEGSDGRAKFKALFSENYLQTMQQLVQRNDQLTTICHGDIWVNNVLFKYEKDSSIPSDVCHIDFQHARYASPVCDLSYFLFCSTTKSVRDQHLKQLLRDYHQFLRSFLESFGYPSDKIVTWDTMEEQYRKYMKFGLGLAIMALPIIMSKKGDLQGVSDDVSEDSSLADTLTGKDDNPARDERLSDVVQDMVDLGYI